MPVAIQISLYPLKQENIAEPINTIIEIFKSHNLETHTGSMSTLVYGDTDEVFKALKEAYEKATQFGETVMVVTLSNACPMPPKRPK